MAWAIGMTAFLTAGFGAVIGAMLVKAWQLQSMTLVACALAEAVSCALLLAAVWVPTVRERREIRRIKSDTPTFLEQWDAFWTKAERIAREI